MRAVSYLGYQTLPTIGEVAEPDCPRDGVVLQVRATGVCRSDWHAWQGHDEVPSFPHVPGHEYAGVIVEVGADVSSWKVGDRVVVPFALGCGACPTCLDGAHHVCPDNLQPGFTSWGSFADRVAVPRAQINLVSLPDAVDFVSAASIGCRFATSYHAVAERARIREGEWLAVHGCGGIGLSALMVGVAMGARVIAVDVSENALKAARELGAEVVVQGPDDVAARISEITGGGAHVSMDALGAVSTMRASIECLRPRGRHLQVGLMLGDAADTAVPMGRVLAYELALLGSHGMPAGDYGSMLDLVASGQLRPDRLVGKVIALSEAGEALAAMSQPPTGSGMTVVDLELR
ncbi:MAG: zinc-dependent alcohol dehydrogenase family protein [Actinobacteria bacterium]|nr:zinc-dependent alcohol dehydrogenase family protein [Actinomycetota bacterium]